MFCMRCFYGHFYSSLQWMFFNLVTVKQPFLADWPTNFEEFTIIGTYLIKVSLGVILDGRQKFDKLNSNILTRIKYYQQN